MFVVEGVDSRNRSVYLSVSRGPAEEAEIIITLKDPDKGRWGGEDLADIVLSGPRVAELRRALS